MLRAISRSLQTGTEREDGFAVTLHTPESDDDARLTLEVLSSRLNREEWQELSGLLTSQGSRVVFNPGDVMSGPNGPIVRFDLKWVTWLQDEVLNVASLVVVDEQS